MDVLSDVSYPVVRFVAVHQPHVDIGVVWDSGTVIIDSGSVFSLMRLSLRWWRGAVTKAARCKCAMDLDDLVEVTG